MASNQIGMHIDLRQVFLGPARATYQYLQLLVSLGEQLRLDLDATFDLFLRFHRHQPTIYIPTCVDRTGTTYLS